MRSVRWTMDVELGKVREFDAATRFSRVAQVGDAVPPTFLTTASLCWQREDDRLFARLGFDLARSLHAEESYEFLGEPPRVGDRLTAESVLESRYDKVGTRSGPLRFAIVRTDFWNDRTLVATQRMTIVERSAQGQQQG